MITLGEIISINDDTNLCLVKLPTLEGVGNKNKVELHATMMLPPGINAGYEVGDVVFVSFVDNTLGRPTVLGQLYRGPGRGTKIDNIGRVGDESLGRAKTISCIDLDAKANIACDTLEATKTITCSSLASTNSLIAEGAVKLPQSTQFYNTSTGSSVTLLNLISEISELKAEVAKLKTEVTKLKTEVTELRSRVDF